MKMKWIAFYIVMLFATKTNAATFISTTTNADIGSLPMTNGDLVRLDPLRTELSGHDLFGVPVGFNGSNKNIDAIARYGDGWLYSTSTDHTHNGITYLDGDLVLLRPGVGTSLFLSESIFAGNEDIDALEIMQDGRLLISTDSDAMIGGLIGGSVFTAGDVIAYDIDNGTYSTWFRGADYFNSPQNIDALALLPDGSMLFSTADDASIGAFSFRDGDVVRFDGSHFSLWLSEGIFAEDEDIDALAVADVPITEAPEPGTAWLFGAGLYALAHRRRCK